LFVGRPVWEGGQYEGDDTTRFETLRLAMELGVDYVDIELKVRLFEQSNLLCFFNCLDNWKLKLYKWGTELHVLFLAFGYKYSIYYYYHKSKVGCPHRSVKYAPAIHYAYISLAEKLFHLL